MYKVWAPGSATTEQPTLTLHNTTTVRFFVEALLAGSSRFIGKPFTMVAYHVMDELMERQVAEGTYRLHMEEGYPRLFTMYEAGMLADYGACQVTCAALLDAISDITKERE